MEIYARRTGAEYHIEEDLRRFLGVEPTKLILLASPEERDQLHDDFRARLASRAFITKSDPEYLEIMAPGVDKGAALRLIARHHGVPERSVLAVGDADNDIGMLGAAGRGHRHGQREPSRQGGCQWRHGAHEQRGRRRGSRAAMGARRIDMLATG